MVPRLPVPPGAEVEALRLSPALQGLHPRRAGAPRRRLETKRPPSSRPPSPRPGAGSPGLSAVRAVRDRRPAIAAAERRPSSSPGPASSSRATHALAMAERLRAIGEETGARIVFKSSYDKANRSSKDSFRGPGLEEGLDDPRGGQGEDGPARSSPTSTSRPRPRRPREVLDVLQIPAFLSPPDRPRDVGRARPARPSTSRRASSWRRTTWPRSWRSAARPATRRSSCASAGPRSATTTSSSTCGPSRSCGRSATRSSTTSRTRCSSRAAGRRRAASSSTRRSSPAPPRPRAASTASSSRSTTIPDQALSDQSTQLDVKIVPVLIRALLAVVKTVRSAFSGPPTRLRRPDRDQRLRFDVVAGLDPGLEPAGERANQSESPVHEHARHTGRRGFVGSGAVEDDLPVPRQLGAAADRAPRTSMTRAPGNPARVAGPRPRPSGRRRRSGSGPRRSGGAGRPP